MTYTVSSGTLNSTIPYYAHSLEQPTGLLGGQKGDGMRACCTACVGNWRRAAPSADC